MPIMPSTMSNIDKPNILYFLISNDIIFNIMNIYFNITNT